MRALIGFITVLALWVGFYFFRKNGDYNEQKRLYEEIFKRQESIKSLQNTQLGYLELSESLIKSKGLTERGNRMVVVKFDSLFYASRNKLRRLEYEISNIEKELEKYSK